MHGSSSDWVPREGGGWKRAEVKQTRGLNDSHNHVLKNVFKGAATTEITMLKDEPLHQDYQRLSTTSEAARSMGPVVEKSAIPTRALLAARLPPVPWADPGSDLTHTHVEVRLSYQQLSSRADVLRGARSMPHPTGAPP
ncbi:hypothetical protein WMF37_00295 [Sorangium sp. So ce291]|uniref:hypothetical protein n=1 Tax=Sorangium sp. So ce291 TaxID=3133294 RepID=UPI003F5FB7AA